MSVCTIKQKGKPMRLKITLTLTLLGFLVVTSPLFGQYFYMHKDLAFGQIAVGGGYETVITVTNRGMVGYTGSLCLFKSGTHVPWNPVTINGASYPANQDGQVLHITVPPGVTQTYRITSTETVQGGFGFIGSDNLNNDRTLEGNLTYFIKSGATVTDSVGVLPSQEFLMSLLPFDDFSTIALALANGNMGDSGQTANVSLKLFNDSGANVTTATLTLEPGSHIPRFLSEFFPGVTTVTRGQIRISSNVPILGTALMFVGGQASSLPLAGSPRNYTFTTTNTTNGSTAAGDASLWSDGFYVRGYIRFTGFNGSPLANEENYWVSGLLVQGMLRASFWAFNFPPDFVNVVFGGTSANNYLSIDNFDFSSNSVTGPFVATGVDPTVTTGPLAYGKSTVGNIVLTRTN
jgi:hypothetical protein